MKAHRRCISGNCVSVVLFVVHICFTQKFCQNTFVPDLEEIQSFVWTHTMQQIYMYSKYSYMCLYRKYIEGKYVCMGLYNNYVYTCRKYAYMCVCTANTSAGNATFCAYSRARFAAHGIVIPNCIVKALRQFCNTLFL